LEFEKPDPGSWKIFRILIGCASVIYFSGAGSGPVPRSGAQSPVQNQQKAARRARLAAILREGDSLYTFGKYREAAAKFQAVRSQATEFREFDLAAGATGDLGGCQFAFFQYREALNSFQEAYHLALSAGDQRTAAANEANIATLYSQLGETDGAAQWKERALARLTSGPRKDYLSQIEIELASLRARQGRSTDALELFRHGIEEAARRGNRAVHAMGWNRLGEELLRQNQPERARQAFLEAYRIRRLSGLPLDGSYCDLGRLRLVEGDFAGASDLLDRAIELAARQPRMMPPWDTYHLRGRARLAEGRLREAMDDLRIAVRLARAWQWSGPALDSTRTGSEGILHEIHSALIDAGNRLYVETGSLPLIEETFRAAEENRASSLRQLLQDKRRAAGDLPPAYWQALNGLQRAEVAALRDAGPVTEDAVRAARAELVRLDTEIAPDTAPEQVDVGRLREQLDSSTVLLSFHLGDSVSWLWALDHGGLALYGLPARARIESLGAAAAQAIRENAAVARPAGARLYRALFGSLDARFLRKERWLLALERGMLGLPIAALPVGPETAAPYLAERHIIEVVPGAAHWQDSPAQNAQGLAPVFLGVGDPIYNDADPRQATRASSPPRTVGVLQAAPASGISAVLLPRLAGSASELQSCARSWEGASVLLTGADASREKLRHELERSPEVVHFATHVLQSSEHPSYGLIALTLTPQGATELLPPFEIAHWRIRAGLVVLSGCYSAAGAEAAPAQGSPAGTYASLPGPGLMGLTRAWLAAGARSVVASRWTMPDADGTFFGSFYRDYRGRDSRERDAARSLRAAQLEMIRSGGWRAEPRYWGAYFVVGNP
jgi:CHAT domain-containing protein